MRSGAWIAAASALALAACQPAPPAATPAAKTQPQAAAQTEAPAAATLSIADAWASATPGGARVSAGYLTIRNAGGAADQLIGAESPRAGRVELHVMEMDGAMMQMRPTASVEAPAGGEVVLAPGGTHLMFLDVTAPFTPGETIPVTLTFAQAGRVEASLPVRTRP
ncbi:MAG: copper chaperone PCu(A)C [Hyphomonadaceae bacterium]|nr:copper chaperone PCu(A)C [Hyphomonadaceae bacterium]